MVIGYWLLVIGYKKKSVAKLKKYREKCLVLYRVFKDSLERFSARNLTIVFILCNFQLKNRLNFKIVNYEIDKIFEKHTPSVFTRIFHRSNGFACL